MPYATNRDRNIMDLEYTKTPWPLPPLNLFLTSGYQPGVFDLRWDNPAILALNSEYRILGVNIYRSFDSEFGPFHRITDTLACTTFWRDRTDNELIIDEDVSDRFVMRDECGSAAGAAAPRWVFKTLHCPIVKEGSQAVVANLPSDVWVRIDDVTVKPLRVDGFSGEVEIDPYIYANVESQTLDPSLVPGPDSVVTVTYRRNRSLLKTDLGQRVFYRVTTVAVPIDCDLSKVRCEHLIETPIEEAVATSSMEIEKLDYIWREAVRRNRWILEQGGERVKLFIRKEVGLPCVCIGEELYHQPVNDCHVCFTPETLVRTERGYRFIKDISVGDRVLSSDGSFQKVTRLFETPFSGDLVSITSAVSTSPLLATPNHPFRALVGHHNVSRCGPKTCGRLLKKGDIIRGVEGQGPGVRRLPSGRWWARVGSGYKGKRISLGTFENETEAKQIVQAYRLEHKKAHSLEWVPANELEEHGWLVAQYPRIIEDLEYVEVPQSCRKTAKFGPARQGDVRFEVDEDFLWVVGLYIAEGSAAARSITFALHADEVEFQNRVKVYFEKYGYTASITLGPGFRAVVSVNGSHLSEWFPAWLGGRCDQKRIPEELMWLPPEKQKWLLQGIYDGDGWKAGSEVTQTSEVLALQLTEICHRLGKQPLVRHQRSASLTPKGNPRKLAYCVNWEDENFHHAFRKGRWKFERDGLAKIRDIHTVPYEGVVYNLEVEGEHTYVVQGIVVHNCYGTGILGGYEGPYDAMIAPDDAERRITQKDTGRTLEHMYEVWTGPTPILSQRDFLVKINGMRYSIGAVRFPSNRGMVLQQHFNIGHLDEKDIRYQVMVGNPVKYEAVQFKPRGPEQEARAEPTEKPNIPDERELRGRTPVWENIEF